MPEQAMPGAPNPGRELNAAEELKRLNGVFLAGLNHEIRTPLSGILGMTDLLLETPLDSEQKEYVQNTKLCAENLLETLNATLEYSALAAGGVRLEEVEFDVLETLAGATAQPFARAVEQGMWTKLDMGDDFPQTLLGDPLRLRQLIGHVLACTLKHAQTGGVEVVLREPERGTLDISVSSTGFSVGIIELHHLLSALRGGVEGQLGYAGLRLSLAVSDKMAELLGGELRLESGPDGGVTFRLVLPMRRPEVAIAAPAQERPSEMFQILVVEDNPIGQRVLTHMLKKPEYAIYFADTGRSAVETASEVRFDLILMDLHMPDMSGLDAAARIRRIHGYEDVPILALTADASDQYREMSRQQGLQAYLTKPIQAAELHAAMKRFLHTVRV
jgi:CheY-like chemotaxis protein